MTVQYAQPLCVAEQFEAAPEHRVVARLAGVAGDSPALRGAIDRQPEVEFGRRTTAECGTNRQQDVGGGGRRSDHVVLRRQEDSDATRSRVSFASSFAQG